MSDPIVVKFKKEHPRAKIPAYQSADAAGFDLAAVIDSEIAAPAITGSNGETAAPSIVKGTLLEKGQTKVIPTGLSVAIPKGYELQIRPRSGLAAKNGLTVLNSPGTVDADFRGEIKVILTNLGPTDYFIKDGERIAQGVIAAVPAVRIEEVESLDQTARGTGGFGSTGRS